MESIHIRRGLEPDPQALAAFAARTFADAFCADNRAEDIRAHLASAYGITQHARELTEPSAATLLLHGGGTLVAYAQVKIKSLRQVLPMKDRSSCSASTSIVGAHGSGVAQQLMAAARTAAREFGGQHLPLGVWERNQIFTMPRNADGSCTT